MTKKSARPSPPQLGWSEVVSRRLDRRALASPSKSAAPADIAAAMCGAHAQIMSAAELSIGVRLAAGTAADIRAALWTDHSLIKTFGPRGTIHLLPARDLPMWTGALSAIPTPPSPFPKDVQLTADQTEAVIAAIAAALKDAELTLAELGEAIVAATGRWAGDLAVEAFQTKWPRWRLAEREAAKRGALVFGPNRGRNVTYTHPRRLLPGFRPMKAPAALRCLVVSYLRSYGPATPQHFAQWLSAPPAWARALFAALADQLQEVEVEGTLAFDAAGDEPAAATPPPNGVRLLPYFDAYTIGSHPRSLVFPARAKERALASGQAGNLPVLLIGGVVAGVWHMRRSGRKLDITVEPLDRLTAGQRRGLEDQVQRIGQFLEGNPTLTVGTVTAGGHA